MLTMIFIEFYKKGLPLKGKPYNYEDNSASTFSISRLIEVLRTLA